MRQVVSTLTSAAVALALLGLVGLAPRATADSAPDDPTDPATPTTVSADALPTAQVDGVVWSQAVVGNTVYAAGSFTSARPAGVQRGVSEVPRSNLLAYDLRTGVLRQDFAPTTNAQVLSIAAAPDGSRLYIGGEFTSVNGTTRSRVASLDLTGRLDRSFAPAAGSTVRAVLPTDDTVYLGGDFTQVTAGATIQPRSHAAALSTGDGSVLPWDPSPDASVLAMTLVPDGSRVVLGGRFQTLAGQPAYGMGAVDATTGVPGAWAASSVISNAGPNTGINALAADDDSIYGTGYKFGPGGNFEGMFRADPATGEIITMEDCHGDTYAVAPRGPVVYVAGHPHSCATIGGFPETNPRRWFYGLAFSKARAGTIATNTQNGYSDFAGRPAPRLQQFFPRFGPGTFTGQGQAAWSVIDAGDYLLYAGEFPTVNGKIQQGLVRMADPQNAPNLLGPTAPSAPVLTSPAAGIVTVDYSTAADPDNATLTYRVYRDDTLVRTSRATSPSWRPQPLSVVDTAAPAGSTASYTVTATDPFGNSASSPSATTAVSSTPSEDVDAYSLAVLGSRPDSYWRLNERSGPVAADLSGNERAGTYQGRSTRRTPGAVRGSTSTSATLAATRGSLPAGSVVAGPAVSTGPGASSVELWFRTSARRAGRLVGIGESRGPLSNVVDRVVTISSTGRLTLTVQTAGARRTATGRAAYNDGRWHHLVASVGSEGSRLVVDGTPVATNSRATSSRGFTGYWRVGADASSSGQRAATPFVGSVDEIATYSRVLGLAEVAEHRARGVGEAANQPPTPSFSSTVNGTEVILDATGSRDPDGTVESYAWDFGDGSTGTGATASRTYATSGPRTVTLTVTDDDGDTSVLSRRIVVNTPPTAQFSAVAKDLGVRLDASASGDDGDIVRWDWRFGDGGSGSGQRVSHTFAAPGRYAVRLTVTDDQGLTSTATQTVTATAPVVRLVGRDRFERTTSNGLGTADTGGDWLVSGGRAGFSTQTGTAVVRTPPGGSLRAALPLSVLASDTTVEVSVDEAPQGGGISLGLSARGTTSNSYRGHVGVSATGGATAVVAALSEGSTTTLASAPLAGVQLVPGSPLRMRLQVDGSEPTTIRFKVWPAAEREPASWSVEVTDATAGLQGAGGVGLWSFLNPAATNPAISVRWDELAVTTTDRP